MSADDNPFMAVTFYNPTTGKHDINLMFGGYDTPDDAARRCKELVTALIEAGEIVADPAPDPKFHN